MCRRNEGKVQSVVFIRVVESPARKRAVIPYEDPVESCTLLLMPVDMVDVRIEIEDGLRLLLMT